MDYWPNADAASWFEREVLPAVLRAHPRARFYVVEVNPLPAVQALARNPAVVVTGRVPDTRPYLQHASVVVAPLRIARGVQNKVLEAMAMAHPVVASAQAAEGIRAEAGRDFILAQGEAEFAHAVVAQLQTAASAPHARECILANYDWARNLAVIDPLFEQGAVLPPILETCLA